MVEWLTFLVILCLVVCGTFAAIVIGLLHLLSVRNRVVPGRRCAAPLTWLVSPEGAARLHRRLQRAMTMAPVALRGRSGDDLGLGDILSQLQERACELDEQLVIAGNAPRRHRHRMLRELHSEVSELELLVQRTVRMGRAWNGGDPSERGLSAVRERLELLESALRELDGVEVSHLRRRPESALERRHSQF